MKAYTIDTEFDASYKYIVDNIIARKSITLIVASPKKGKTALGLNLGICINEGIDFLENKVRKTNVVYYCNELSGRLIQERIKRLDIPCSNTMKFYEGTSYVDFGEFERIIKSELENKIADEILKNEILSDEKLFLDVKKGNIVLEKVKIKTK